MHNSFISIVTVVESSSDFEQLPNYLKSLYQELEKSFTDHEIILVNNSLIRDFKNITEQLDQNIKKNIFLLNLSSIVNRNHAIVAGLDRGKRRLYGCF